MSGKVADVLSTLGQTHEFLRGAAGNMILLLTAVGSTSALAVKILVLVALVMLRMVLMLLTMMPAVKRGFGSELELIFFSFVSIPHVSED